MMFSTTELAAARPPERITISDWAEAKRILTAPSEERGPFRMARTPYLVDIVNTFQIDEVEEVVICKPAQIAGTEALLCVLGYYADQSPCSIMMVLADEDTAKYMAEKRIQAMFRASPSLAVLIDESKFSQDEITLRNGAYVAMGWASSVAKLASRPIKVMIFDEIDKPGYSSTNSEASALSLGRERTETYYSKKIGKLSSPTIEEGNIWRELKSCDVVFDWHVPCPRCGVFQPLVWSRAFCQSFPDGRYRDPGGVLREVGQVVWEGGREATQEQIAGAVYECGTCRETFGNIEKNFAVQAGKYVPRDGAKARPKKVGFHINRLISLLGRSGDLAKLVDDFIRCKKSGDPKLLQGFVNSTLAEPWRSITVAATEGNILRARVDLPPQTVPESAIVLTCGVDVQKYNLWFRVRAWAADFTSWGIHEGTIASFDDLAVLLFQAEYPQIGTEKKFRIWRAGIDTGGGDDEAGLSRTEETYTWIRRNGVGRGCRCWGTKGSSHPLQGRIKSGSVLDKLPSGKPIGHGGLQLVLLDTNQLKDAFHYRLGQAIKSNSPESDGATFAQAAFLHSGTGAEYVNHIMAERKEIDRKKRIETWVRRSRDNHLLDCEVICHALVDPEWPGGGLNLIRKEGPKPAAEAERKPNPYMRGGAGNPYLRR